MPKVLKYSANVHVSLHGIFESFNWKVLSGVNKRKDVPNAFKMCCLRSTKQRGTLTEYLSTFFGLELFPCPNGFTPPRAVLRGKQMGFGHPVAKNDSNIQRTKGV